MTRNFDGGIDMFAKGISELVGDIPDACSEACGKAVQRSVRKGAKALRGEKTAGIGRHPWSEEYRGGFASRVDRKGPVTTGEVGNKAKPGLVHLLEKGHVTLTSRRTAAFPHMAPTFDEMQDDFADEVKRSVGEVLS